MYNISLYEYTTTIYPFSCYWICRLFPDFYYSQHWSEHPNSYLLLQMCSLFSIYIWKWNYWVVCYVHFQLLTRSCQIIFHSVWTSFHSRHQYVWISHFPTSSPCQIVTFANLIGMEWQFCFNMCFLISSVIQHLFICLLAIGDLPVHVFCPLFYWIIFPIISVLYIFWIWILSWLCALQIFSSSLWLTLHVICGIFLFCNSFYFKVAIFIRLFLCDFCFLCL